MKEASQAIKVMYSDLLELRILNSRCPRTLHFPWHAPPISESYIADLANQVVLNGFADGALGRNKTELLGDQNRFVHRLCSIDDPLGFLHVGGEGFFYHHR